MEIEAQPAGVLAQKRHAAMNWKKASRPDYFKELPRAEGPMAEKRIPAKADNGLRLLYKDRAKKASNAPESKARDLRLYEICFYQAEGGFLADSILTARKITDLLMKSFAFCAAAEFASKRGKPNIGIMKEGLAFAEEYGLLKKKTDGPEDRCVSGGILARIAKTGTRMKMSGPEEI